VRPGVEEVDPINLMDASDQCASQRSKERPSTERLNFTEHVARGVGRNQLVLRNDNLCTSSSTIPSNEEEVEGDRHGKRRAGHVMDLASTEYLDLANRRFRCILNSPNV